MALEAKEATPVERIDAAVRDIGLTMTAVFVPWSQSRNKGEKYPSLNWLVTLHIGKSELLTTNYMAGSGHCPAYKASVRAMGGANCIMRQDAIKWECENGKTARTMEGYSHITGGNPILLDMRDVLHSLVPDADVIDAGGFIEWADTFGYDSDSRKAEATYRACLEIALKLRNSLGEANLTKLREACQDY